ncbi:MAG: hypothetical protein ACO3Z6_01385 [Pseudomonadales bacterium]
MPLPLAQVGDGLSDGSPIPAGQAFVAIPSGGVETLVEPPMAPSEAVFDQSLTWAERDQFLELEYGGRCKCPTCQSANTRASRYRREDGYPRRLFFSAYRCRRCGKRFFQARMAAVGGSVAAAFTSFALFVALSAGVLDIRHLLRPAIDPAQVSAADIAHQGAVGLKRGERLAELEEAAASGDASAQFELGRQYLDDRNGNQDLSEARSWIHRAAEQGHVGAQSLLGHMYHAGSGALQSFTLAHDWLMRAARQNDPEAQFSLGVMYRDGQAVEADPVAAYTWFNLAAAQGSDDASDARDHLLMSLTPAQVLAAQTASEQWKPGDLDFKSERLLASSAVE